MQLNYFDTMVRAQKSYARLLEPICGKWELTRNELDVILFLANHPGRDRAVDIVNGRGMSKSHVSLSVANLEARGFLTRQEDPADRRTVHLTLAEQAQTIAESGRQAQRQFFGRIYEGVSREEMEIWRGITEKVSRNILALEAQQDSSK